MVDLACCHDEKNPVHLKDIADNHGISSRFLVQIMLQLKGAGLVDSTRGAGGGYLLARAAEKISLADIINAIDQAPQPLPSALAGLNDTPVVDAVKRALHEIQEEQQARLKDVTLADLVVQTESAGSLSYQI
jgi:Rrf2 family protein